MTTKTCSTCGETKPTDKFGKKQSNLDGLQSSCKTCRSAQASAYREANREHISAYQRAYREANQDKITAYNRAYYEANRDKITARVSAYYEANRDKLSAYREANRDKIADRNRARHALIGNPTKARCREVTARYATRKYEPWTPEEDRYLLTGPGTNLDKALQLSRTYHAVECRARQLRQDQTA